jgi:hypothetical protein
LRRRPAHWRWIAIDILHDTDDILAALDVHQHYGRCLWVQLVESSHFFGKELFRIGVVLQSLYDLCLGQTLAQLLLADSILLHDEDFWR